MRRLNRHRFWLHASWCAVVLALFSGARAFAASEGVFVVLTISFLIVAASFRRRALNRKESP